MVRAFARHAKDNTLSAAVLFLDLKEAFYRVIRQLAANIEEDHFDLAQLGSRFGLDDVAISELFTLLNGSTAVADAQLPSEFQRAIAAIHSHTWFKFHTQADIVATTHGSRPGDSFADILFGFVYAKVLKAVEAQLVHLEIFSSFPDAGPGFSAPTETSGRVFCGPTWMDDTAVCILATDAQQLEKKLMVTTSVLLDTCRSFGMTPNLAPGKTAVVAAFRGKKSKALRAKHFGPRSTGALPVVCEHGVDHVHITGHYVHFGGAFQHD